MAHIEDDVNKTTSPAKLTCLVADSAAFIRNVDLHNLSERIFTLGDVVNEIRDSATKQRLAVLPYELEFREPSAESIKFVTEFSKKTGDYKSLSAVDLRVIALTHQLEKEFGDGTNIKLEPTKKSVIVPKAQLSDKEISGFYIEKKNKENKTSEENSKEQKEEQTENAEETNEQKQEESMVVDEIQKSVDDTQNNNNEVPTEQISTDEQGQTVEQTDEEMEQNDDNDNNDDDDDSEGWITPSNISKMKEKMGMDDETTISESNIKCACLTTDFAMQNVLIQMGLHVLSVHGMLIRHARNYIQKCYGCYKETHNMEATFCPSCGNKTLMKVAVSVADDGTLQYFYPKRRRNFNIRGTKFSMPAPKSGRHVTSELILCADQHIKHDRLPKKRDKVNPLDPDYASRSSPFAMNDVNSRAFNLGAHVKHTKARNPNENKKKKSGRRK